jgi:hypothetical protein
MDPRIHILLTCGSALDSAPDPDPGIFVSDLQDVKNKISFLLITVIFEGTCISFFKDKNSNRSHKSRYQCFSERPKNMIRIRNTANNC